jgi:exodeoxyribonuclease V alpha subunit
VHALPAHISRHFSFLFFPPVQVTYAGPELDALQSAWAVTVHKAQGSEFPAVALLLHEGHHPLLSRKLLYTALSRASKLLVVISAPGPLGARARAKAPPP